MSSGTFYDKFKTGDVLPSLILEVKKSGENT